MDEILKLLRCPVTGNELVVASQELLATAVPGVMAESNNIKFDSGLTDKSFSYFYPVVNGIYLLHSRFAIYTGTGGDIRTDMPPDKKRVFDYYNNILFKEIGEYEIYEDSGKWVDYRDVSSDYIKNSFRKASLYYPPNGRFFLDIASGPIGVPEYMSLSDGYEYRICVDISVNALMVARKNMEQAGKKGFYICGDITAIPIADNCCDVVLSQHTLYHIPKDDQRVAVNEMYRVAGPGAPVVIVYSWFYHSWFMNISLNVVQIYRVLRHFAGKAYLKIFGIKPVLYFYAHSPRWFRKNFAFSDDIRFFCWRSTNKHFLSLFVHKLTGGRRFLAWLARIEEKHSLFMGLFGEYPVITVTKLNSRHVK